MRNPHKLSRFLIFLMLLLAVSITVCTCLLVWTAQGASQSAIKEGSVMIFGTPTPTPTTKPTTYPAAQATSQQLWIPTTTPTTKPTTYPAAQATSQQLWIPTTTPPATRTTVPPTETTLPSPVTTQTTLSSSQSQRNTIPSAVLLANPDFGSVPLIVEFDGSGSNDPDGDALVYNWDFGDGGSGQGPLVKHTFGQEGSYQVVLIVTDEQGLSDIAIKIINVAPATTEPGQIQNLPPQASLSAEPTEGPAPLQVYFSSSGTTDPEGHALSYLWDFGDGTTSTDETPIHLFQSPGHYMATLLVTDTGGFSDIGAVDIDVRETASGGTTSDTGQQHATETQSAGSALSSLILLSGFSFTITGLFFRWKKN